MREASLTQPFCPSPAHPREGLLYQTAANQWGSKVLHQTGAVVARVRRRAARFSSEVATVHASRVIIWEVVLR